MYCLNFSPFCSKICIEILLVFCPNFAQINNSSRIGEKIHKNWYCVLVSCKYLNNSQATGRASTKAASERMHALLLSTDNGTWKRFRMRALKYLRMGAVGLPGPPDCLLGPTRRVDFLCSSSSLPLWTLRPPLRPPRPPCPCCNFCWNWCICNWCKLPPRSISYN